MTTKYRKIFLFKSLQLLLLGASVAHAQAGELAEDSGTWMQAVGEGSMKIIDPSLQKGRIWLEGQSRFDGNWDHWYQGMVRTAVGYSLSDRATIWAGYTWLPTHNIGKDYIAQQDVWPAFRYILPTDIGTITFRTLWESNFLLGNQVRERPRQMIKFVHPFEFEPRLSFVTWDEAFYRVNTTTWGGKSGFDQNRAFAGVGWNFNSNVRTELGYLNQYIEDANHINATMHHLAMASVFINF